MTEVDQHQQAWGPCPHGELLALARHLKFGRAVKICAQLGAVCALLIVAGVGFMVARGGRPEPLGHITCSRCAACFEAYHRHLIHQQSMDKTLAEQMQEHFALCAKCRAAFEKRFPGELVAQAAADVVGLVVGVQARPAWTAAGLFFVVSSP